MCKTKLAVSRSNPKLENNNLQANSRPACQVLILKRDKTKAEAHMQDDFQHCHICASKLAIKKGPTSCI